MLNIGFPELILIAIVALLVVGPSKLPEVARSVGKALGEFRRMADDVKESWQKEMNQEDVTMKETDEAEAQSVDNTKDPESGSVPESGADNPSKKA